MEVLKSGAQVLVAKYKGSYYKDTQEMMEIARAERTPTDPKCRAFGLEHG